MRRLVFVAVFAAILGTSLSAREAKPIATRMYIVEPSILEGDPKGSIEKGTIRTLAHPKVMMREGEDASILIGGCIGAQIVPHGMSLKAKVEPTNNGKVRVTGVFELSTVKTLSEGMVLRHATSVHFSEAVVLGERIRVPMSESENGKQWFELLVGKVPPETQR